MADALEALNEIDVRIAALTDAASSGRSKYLPSSAVQPITRAIAKTYFEAVRSELQIVQNRAKLTDEIDFSVQGLLQLGAGQSRAEQIRFYVLAALVKNSLKGFFEPFIQIAISRFGHHVTG